MKRRAAGAHSVHTEAQTQSFMTGSPLEITVRHVTVTSFILHLADLASEATALSTCPQMLPPPVPISVWIKTEGILHLTTSLHVHGTGVPVESCAEAFAPDKHKVGGFTSCKHRLSRSSIFTRFHRICYK